MSSKRVKLLRAQLEAERKVWENRAKVLDVKITDKHWSRLEDLFLSRKGNNLDFSELFFWVYGSTVVNLVPKDNLLLSNIWNEQFFGTPLPMPVPVRSKHE